MLQASLSFESGTSLVYTISKNQNKIMIQIKCSDFEKEVIEAEKMVVVLFTNEWNGSAIIVEGALDELQKKWSNKFHFVQLSKDQCQKIGDDYKVHFTPTILIFKKGKVIEEITGVKSKNTIENILQETQ